MISLPATDETVLAQVIDPALDVLPPKMRSDEARCLLLAIGRYESCAGAYNVVASATLSSPQKHQVAVTWGHQMLVGPSSHPTQDGGAAAYDRCVVPIEPTNA